MKTVIFNGKFDIESISNFIIKVEDIIEKSPTEKINMYFQSEGGELRSGLILLDYLNTLRDKIIVIGNYSLESCAFDVFMKCENEKRILEDTTAMIHSLNTNYDTRDIRDKENPRHLYLKLDKEINERYMDFYKGLDITGEEVNLMYAGKDVVITYDRFLQILEKQNKENNKTICDDFLKYVIAGFEILQDCKKTRDKIWEG